jgi:hypothetical protein
VALPVALPVAPLVGLLVAPLVGLPVADRADLLGADRADLPLSLFGSYDSERPEPTHRAPAVCAQAPRLLDDLQNIGKGLEGDEAPPGAQTVLGKGVFGEDEVGIAGRAEVGVAVAEVDDSCEAAP